MPRTRLRSWKSMALPMRSTAACRTRGSSRSSFFCRPTRSSGRSGLRYLRSVSCSNARKPFHVARAVTEQVETGRAARIDYLAHPEAYYAYLAGLRNLSSVGLPEIRRARGDFRAALKHKPDFAPALSGMARTYAIEWILTARGDRELLSVAEHHAKGAIESNEDLPGAHREFGVVKLYQGDLDESLAALDLAENLSPHYADVLYSHADTLVHVSRPREALDKLAKALSLNPLAPDTYFWSAAGASYFLENYQDAIGYVQRMKDKSPGTGCLRQAGRCSATRRKHGRTGCGR